MSSRPITTGVVPRSMVTGAVSGTARFARSLGVDGKPVAGDQLALVCHV
jgi:hypothetical protein